MTVGVLAIQGDFAAHRGALERLGVRTVAVRRPADLERLDGMVLPGGESSAMLYGLARDGLEAPLAAFLRTGRPVLGTCAGAILLARAVTNPVQRSFGVLDMDVERNAYGTQRDSFITVVEASGALAGLPAVFIRAPRIVRVGAAVEVLGRAQGDPVLVRTGSTWAATFHPELTGDDRLLRAWLASGTAAGASKPAA